LSDLAETVANVLHGHEDSTNGLILDDLNIAGVEVSPDMLFAPYGLAIMTIQANTYSARSDRGGRD